MNYCKNCYCATDYERCPMCGTKKLREAQEDDFCFLLEKDVAYCGMLTSIFEEKNIRFSTVPYGSGVRSAFGMSLENYRVYVPFASLEAAEKIVDERENFETETFRSSLMENSNLLNVSTKLKKKLEKKFGLSGDEEFFDYCRKVVESARKIVDGGKISYGDAHYLFCYASGVALTVNSKTYEILSLRSTK